MLDTVLGICGLVASVCGLGVSVFAIRDNRRQRDKRERAVNAARELIGRAYGTLIGIKPKVIEASPNLEAAINNALSAIDQRRPELDNL